MSGLVPDDPWEEAKVQEVIQLVNQDIRERVISPTMREPDPEKKAAMRKVAAEEKLPAKLALLESFLSVIPCAPVCAISAPCCLPLYAWTGPI